MDVQGRFDLPPEEAVKYFRSKGLRKSWAWQDTWAEEHNTSFVVAKMTDLDLLADVHDAVNAAISQGQTLAQFKKSLTPTLVKAGWWGEREQTDPATGKTEIVQLGSARRLETIFRTNMTTAYSAGEWAQIQEAAEDAPYLMYDAVDDNRTRDQHRQWNGTVLRWDDAWWQTHRPPNGWGCRCSVIQLSARDLRGMGKSGPDKEAPAIKRREWTNKRTGEVMQIPEGIDAGWDYNPGANRPRAVASQMLDKVAGVSAPLGATAYSRVMPNVLPQIRESFADFVDAAVAEAANPPARPQGRAEIAGVLQPAVLSWLREHAISPMTSEIAVQKATVAGRKQDRHIAAGDALTADDWKRLPDILAEPSSVLYDTEDNALIYVGDLPDSKDKHKVVLVLDFVYQKKTRLNLVRTAMKRSERSLKDGRYVTVQGREK